VEDGPYARHRRVDLADGLLIGGNEIIGLRAHPVQLLGETRAIESQGLRCGLERLILRLALILPHKSGFELPERGIEAIERLVELARSDLLSQLLAGLNESLPALPIS
jgi:hypothetical protein